MIEFLLAAGLITSTGCPDVLPEAEAILVPKTPDRARMEERVQEGKAHAEAKRYGQALLAFEKAYAANPMPSLFFNMAQLHRILGDRSSAHKNFQLFLENAKPDPESPFYQASRSQIQALEKELGQVVVPDAAHTVTVGEEQRSSGAFWIDPGTYCVGFWAHQEQKETESITVVAGQTTPIVIPDLPAVRMVRRDSLAPPRVAVESQVPAVAEVPLFKKWWFWTAVGAAVAAGSVGLIAAQGGDTLPDRGPADLGSLDASSWNSL